MPHFTTAQWLLACLGALCIGLGKTGFSGVSLASVVIVARLFPPRESTGILLPLLICGDIGSVLAFRQHAEWKHIWRMLPPTVVGIVAGFLLMGYIPDRHFGAVIGVVILVMTMMQAVRKFRPGLYAAVPHTRGFAWSMGAATGATTMVANGAGPIMALYLLAISLPKLVFVGTSAWFFLIVNLIKVPFSAKLGLIRTDTLLFNLVLVPMVALGTLSGRWLIRIVPQELFEVLLLLFTTAASLRLMGVW